MEALVQAVLEAEMSQAIRAEKGERIFEARNERVREAGVIVSQAVHVAVGIDWDGRRQILGVELANRESQSSCHSTHVHSQPALGGPSMPLALFGRTKDAVIVVPASTDWRPGVQAFLRSLGADDANIGRHLTLLEERAAGRRPWLRELDGRTLPNGRPMPPGRAYTELLVAESALPLYDAGGFLVSIDLHNPGNEAGVSWYDPEVVEIALVADTGAFTGESLGAAGLIEQRLAQRAERGARLGELVAALAENVRAQFAYVDVGPTGGVVTSASSPTAVVHPTEAPLRPADFLWSITVWGPELLEPSFEARLDALSITEAQLNKIDRYIRPHVRLEQRRFTYGARMLQFRFLFGSEQRGERRHLDSPLAKRLGLRSTNLQCPSSGFLRQVAG